MTSNHGGQLVGCNDEDNSCPWPAYHSGRKSQLYKFLGIQ